jgi:hypothetical protein
MANINEERALRKTINANKVTYEIKLGILTYQIKCKWESQVKKAELRLGVEQERDCT